VQVALREATLQRDQNSADAADLAEELETRLAAVLYLTGQLTRRTGIHDVSDQVAAWESDLPEVEGSWPVRYRWHTQDEALAVLEAAAVLCATLAVCHDRPGRAGTGHACGTGPPVHAVPGIAGHAVPGQARR
jgi:hypothetical protein